MGNTYTIVLFILNHISLLITDSTLEKWVKQNGWKTQGSLVMIASQDEKIKTKNITEKIEFDNLGGLMAQCL